MKPTMKTKVFFNERKKNSALVSVFQFTAASIWGREIEIAIVFFIVHCPLGILTAQSCDGDGGYDDTADEGGADNHADQGGSHEWTS